MNPQKYVMYNNKRNNNKQRKIPNQATEARTITLCGSSKLKLIEVYSFMTFSCQTYSEPWLFEMEFYC